MFSNYRLFSPKSLIILILVAIAFYYLFNYRYNNPLKIGTNAPNIIFETLSGKKFTLNEINLPKALVFFSDNTMFTKHYLKFIRELRLIDTNYLYPIIIYDIKQDPKIIRNKLNTKDHLSPIKDITYIVDIDKVSHDYKVRSFPHFYLLNTDNIVIYQSKVPSIDKIKTYIRSF